MLVPTCSKFFLVDLMREETTVTIFLIDRKPICYLRFCLRGSIVKSVQHLAFELNIGKIESLMI